MHRIAKRPFQLLALIIAAARFVRLLLVESASGQSHFVRPLEWNSYYGARESPPPP